MKNSHVTAKLHPKHKSSIILGNFENDTFSCKLKKNIESCKIFFNHIYQGVQPVKQPERFWSLSKTDLLCFLIMIIPTLLIWTVTSYKTSIKTILKYWDGPNYIYAAITLYRIPEDYIWKRYFNYDPSYFACHLPGYPMLIRICSFICFGNYVYGAFLSILVSNFLLSYSFRRLLIVFRCVKDPTWSTIVLSLIPFRLVIYHSVLASEPLFITFICLSFIFYKFDRISTMILFIWCGCFTRIEGMAVGFIIGVCYLIRFDILRALLMFSTFIPDLFLVWFHTIMFNDPLAYIHFNSGNQQIMSLHMFFDIFVTSRYGSELVTSHVSTIYLLGLIGVFYLLPSASPLSFFSGFFYLYVSQLRHLDTGRYFIPCSVFSLVAGFDSIFGNYRGKLISLIAYPIFLSFLVWYAVAQIPSNICTDEFFDEVINSRDFNL